MCSWRPMPLFFEALDVPRTEFCLLEPNGVMGQSTREADYPQSYPDLFAFSALGTQYW